MAAADNEGGGSDGGCVDGNGKDEGKFSFLRNYI